MARLSFLSFLHFILLFSLSRIPNNTYTIPTKMCTEKQLLNGKNKYVKQTENELAKTWKSIQIFACLGDISISMRRETERNGTKHAEENGSYVIYDYCIFFNEKKEKKTQRHTHLLQKPKKKYRFPPYYSLFYFHFGFDFWRSVFLPCSKRKKPWIFPVCVPHYQIKQYQLYLVVS